MPRLIFNYNNFNRNPLSQCDPNENICPSPSPFGACCEPLCCNWAANVLWAPNDGTYEPPGGWIIPEGVPGYTNVGDNGTFGTWSPTYNNVFEPIMVYDCLWDLCDEDAALAHFAAAVQSVDPYLGTEYEAVVSMLAFEPAGNEPVVCGGNTITQIECEEIGGIWHATPQECYDNCGVQSPSPMP